MSAVTSAGKRQGRQSGIRRHAWWTPYAFLAPFLVIFGAFVALPALLGLWTSFFDWDYMLDYKPFVGLQNYANLFDSSTVQFEAFWNGMKATGIFTLVSVPILVVLPLMLAVLLNRRFPGRTFFRAMVFMPYVLGVAVVGLLFRFILDPNIGIVNALIEWTRLEGLVNALGIGTPIPWITAQPWAWVSLVLMTVWWTAGFNAIIYLAGLQDIPAELYDAAKVDGASAWQRFRYVTLPSLRTVLIFVITITILSSANLFGQPTLVTNGGPGDSTRTVLMVILDEGLAGFRFGSASAMGYVLALVLGLVSVLNFVAFRERSGRR